MNRLVAAVSVPETRDVALELMERVALGHTSDVSAESTARVGLQPSDLQANWAGYSSTRAYAFQKIGETGLPEALAFLSAVKQSDIGPDTSHEVWLAAQIALRNIRLMGIVDPQMQIAFLERTIREVPLAASWAVDQLCDRGSYASLPLIRRWIGQGWPGRYGEDQARFCERRIQIISRGPNRATALGSVLSVGNSTDDDPLLRWAIYQLQAMHRPEALAEVKRFATEVRNLPEGTPIQQRFATLKGEIDEIANRPPPE